MNYNLVKDTVLARKRTFTVLVLLLVVDVASLIYLGGFQGPHLATLQTSFFAKRQEVARMKGADTATLYAEGVRDLQNWNARILPKKDFARMLEELFELAQNNNTAITGVSYKPFDPKRKGLEGYAIDFSVTGKYAGVKSLVADLMRSRQMIVIDRMSLSNSSPTSEEITLKLGLETYFRGVEGK